MNERAKMKKINNEQDRRIQNLRLSFSKLYDEIEAKCKTSRETSLCLTKLEEAQFWAIKGISREEDKNEKECQNND